MSALQALSDRMMDVNALDTATAVMDWDQQTYMPKQGAAARGEHVGRLSRMRHELFTSDETRSLLEKAKGEAKSEEEVAMIRVVKRDFDLATKLPSDLVAEKVKLGSDSQEIWVEARANNDFKSFAPYLQRMFELARQEAEHLGYKEHIYDALLDQYEEGATAAEVRSMFDSVRDRQVELVKQIQELPETDDSFLHGDWLKESQSKFTEELVQAIGFDFNRGRQDVAPHPFCTHFSSGDVRLTTRFQEFLGSSIFGSLHEAGHGMYEQGSPAHWDRTPLAGGVSLGIHESQSRTWENIIGRSRAFWEHFYSKLQSTFPALQNRSIDEFHRAVNKVKPSFIRVEADELTYNLHIMVRFELECDLLEGALAVHDLPEAWNEKYRQYLGIVPKTDSVGCLQDVHWSGGLIGYFPTYSMGNLLSYQIWNALKVDIPNPEANMAKGEFKPILEWLKLKVYSQAKRYTPKELVQRVTGKPMGAEDYLAGLEEKYRAIYGLS
ncbi:MAG TPA: carboxypeptidase M32 [Fimbriimonadaceae bacterium]|nr:carboxypeptidase M32 [Fimbriimonadaceae bacterium]